MGDSEREKREERDGRLGERMGCLDKNDADGVNERQWGRMGKVAIVV